MRDSRIPRRPVTIVRASGERVAVPATAAESREFVAKVEELLSRQ